jgi:hypothetical protein
MRDTALDSLDLLVKAAIAGAVIGLAIDLHGILLIMQRLYLR